MSSGTTTGVNLASLVVRALIGGLLWVVGAVLGWAFAEGVKWLQALWDTWQGCFAFAGAADWRGCCLAEKGLGGDWGFKASPAGGW